MPDPVVSMPFLAGAPKRLLVGGEWVAARSGATFATINPSNGRELVQLAVAGAGDVDAAVQAARRAFETTWRRTRPAERQRLLLALVDLAERNFKELAWLQSLDDKVGFTGSTATGHASATDREEVVQGLRRARAVFATDPMPCVMRAELLPGPGVRTDDELLDYARRYGVTGYHVSATCRTGPPGDRPAGRCAAAGARAAGPARDRRFRHARDPFGHYLRRHRDGRREGADLVL